MLTNSDPFLPVTDVYVPLNNQQGGFNEVPTSFGAVRQQPNFEATIDIATLAVLQGQLPRRALNLVLEWAMIHRAELFEGWRLCRENTRPKRSSRCNELSIFQCIGM